jgi:YesN/AraC family two-component response regulator
MEDKDTKWYILLIVDDEERVRRAVIRSLFDQDKYLFHFIEAKDGEEALKVMLNNPVDLLLCDHQMPGICGLDVMRIVTQRHPTVARVLLSGKIGMRSAVEALNSGLIHQCMLKPWEDEQLISVIVSALKRRDLILKNGWMRARLLDYKRSQKLPNLASLNNLLELLGNTRNIL